LRFGIGSEFHRGAQVDYVLGTWSAEERAALPERCGRCVEAIQTITTAGLATAMGAFNNT
jgi:PTH1 family peptidyl-tRNA hydrolase